VHSGFWWGNLRKRDSLEDIGVDGRIISKWIFTKWDGGMVWIDLAQDRAGGGLAQGRDRWLAVVNLVMNLRVP